MVDEELPSEVVVEKEYDRDERQKLFESFHVGQFAKTMYNGQEKTVKLVVRNSTFLEWFDKIPKNTMWRKFSPDGDKNHPNAELSAATYLHHVHKIGRRHHKEKEKTDVFNVTAVIGTDLEGLEIGKWYSVEGQKYQFLRVLPSSINELNLRSCSNAKNGFSLTVEQVTELCNLLYGTADSLYGTA